MNTEKMQLWSTTKLEQEKRKHYSSESCLISTNNSNINWALQMNIKMKSFKNLI